MKISKTIKSILLSGAMALTIMAGTIAPPNTAQAYTFNPSCRHIGNYMVCVWRNEDNTLGWAVFDQIQ